ncbi:MAG: hypothetical protein ACUVWV_10645, partial [Thermodesulfobacteriota bacterium]
LLYGCAALPIREDIKVDLNLPVGKLEGSKFVGIRFPFIVETPPDWKITTQIPDFMQSLGYEKPGLEESELFIFNPHSFSNLQIDFAPAGRYSKFDQKSIEWLTNAALGSLKQELEQEYGKGIEIKEGPLEKPQLKGVQFAGQKYVTYNVKGNKREQGWVYGFSEPYQIFILYMILEKEGFNDRDQIKKILDSFEVFSK